MRVLVVLLVICDFPFSLGQAVVIPSPPFFVKQPPTTEILFTNFRSFPLQCEAIGEPLPQYIWLKNGVPFNWRLHKDHINQHFGLATLFFIQPRDEDAGQYQCLAMNEHGTATSNSVFLKKYELKPLKSRGTIQVTVEEGEPFKLECEAPEGYPKPVFQWLRVSANGSVRGINDSRLTIDPDGTLWFSKVIREDASEDSNYACVATLGIGDAVVMGRETVLNVTSREDKETAKYGPVRQYVSSEASVATLKGSKKLYCIFGGSPLPQTTWLKNGSPVEFSSRIYLRDFGKTLVLQDVTFDDQGNYTCDVKNGVGKAESHTISLEVQSLVFFTKEPQNLNAAVGMNVELQCEASGVPEPKIRWTYNGRDLSESPNSRRTVEANRIVIERVEASDTGNYGCNASNSLGYVYKDVYINVLSLPPQILEPPQVTLTVEGVDVKLSCRFFAVPMASVTWQFVRNSSRFSVDSNGNLLIKSVQVDDSGVYTCHVENKVGAAFAEAMLLVKNHTQFTKVPEDVRVAAGESAIFHCGAHSDDSLGLDVVWLKSGRVIDFDEDPRVVKLINNSLTILKVGELDAGNYTCRAKTAMDEVSASAQLIVLVVPNSSINVSVQCHSKSATVQWKNLDDIEPISHYTLEYSTGLKPGIWTPATNISANGTQHEIDLSPRTKYSFRVIAVSVNGTSTPSASTDFCEAESHVPSKNPDNVEVHQPGNGSQI